MMEKVVLHDDEEHSKSSAQSEELADSLEENTRSLEALQLKHELEMKGLQIELEKERAKLANLLVMLQDEQKLNKSIQQELKLMKSSSELMSKIQDELNQRIENIKRPQMELDEKKQPLDTFTGKEQLEKDLIEMRGERDKVLQELKQLKQHLLEKASEESERMDKDGKLIEGLRREISIERDYVKRLERALGALQPAVASKEEVKFLKNNELEESKKIINELHKKLASSRSLIEDKRIEVTNILVEYHLAIDAKKRLSEELALLKEETGGLWEQIKNAQREKEDLLSTLSQYKRTLVESQNRLEKIEKVDEKLRQDLLDSRNSLLKKETERKIVIDLLVTYLERNHSKEVLDVLVSVLVLSDKDKQRIGYGQEGVAGESPADNRSMAEKWEDFLLT